MSEIRKRIMKAVDYVEASLDGELTTARVCAAACYSPFHFQRLFSAMTGMSLACYIRRRRLTAAAEKLVASRERIIDIALAAGFESQEAFSRAFKKMYHMNPGVFRDRGRILPTTGQRVIDAGLLDHLQRGGIIMEPTFIEVPEFFVVGLGKDYQVNQPHDIPQLWDRFNARMREIEAKPGSRVVGVCTSAFEDGVMSSDFHYVAAVETGSSAPVPEGMEKVRIPQNRYAVFTHKGSVAALPQTVQYIWGVWLPSSGLELVEAPDFELYDERFDPATGTGEIDIYVPVK